MSTEIQDNDGGTAVEYEPEYDRFVIPLSQIPEGGGIIPLSEGLVQKMCHHMNEKEG